jgi:hypothetical protein
MRVHERKHCLHQHGLIIRRRNSIRVDAGSGYELEMVSLTDARTIAGMRQHAGE